VPSLTITNMAASSAPASASSDAIHAWETALSGNFTDWNEDGTWLKKWSVNRRLKAALGHSLSPFTTAQKQRVRAALMGLDLSDMDFNQWYDMLRAGQWYQVVEQLLPVFDENSPKERMSLYVTDEDWEAALRTRFTGWEVDTSGHDGVQEVLWHCIRGRILRAIELPSSPLSPNQKDTIRREMADIPSAQTIRGVFDMLKTGEWLQAIRRLLPLSSNDEDVRTREDLLASWRLGSVITGVVRSRDS